MEVMEKRSRRRAPDQVTHPAFEGRDENEIGCARISIMAKSKNASSMGRIQMCKTKSLHFVNFGLQRTAGSYSWANFGSLHPHERGLLCPSRADINSPRTMSEKCHGRTIDR